ncbi:alpha/beta hydrolase [Nocardia pneumoniae]|uniref:alpha/beta hydrolase n=1 Tax=Nocardia pneumoniae TaxID=228601 RepID=UPI00030B8815|nr:CocE/NonD family hydrolase [Nocardia pneumoniae]
MVSEVQVEKVTFDSDGVLLVGRLYRPADAGDTRLPAVVVTGSWLTVKEQMPQVYARRLAEQGFTALDFDFTHYGESGGEPRDLESPARKSRDIRAAVTFLAGRPDVDAQRIGALGVCASSGYTAVNAAGDARVRSLAMVAPWLHDPDLVALMYGGKEGVSQRLAAGFAARARYENTGEVDYVAAVSTTDPSAAMSGEFPYYVDATRGAVPEWANRFAVQGWNEWLTYNAIPVARNITIPTLLVHSENGAIPDGARAFHAQLAGPKELIWIEGTQFDFYDQEPTVGQAVEHVGRHFRRTLG